METVLKTVVSSGTVGSNPTLSANPVYRLTFEPLKLERPII